MQKRPRMGACTPEDETLLKLLGGETVGSDVMFTRDQMKALERVYGPLDHAEMQQRLNPDFIGPLKDPNPTAEALLLAGSKRNLCRWMERDGLRVMGLLLHFLEQGEDPVRLVVRALADAGYDVGDHVEWAEGELDEGVQNA